MKTIKIIIAILCLGIIVSGCQSQDNIKNYNQISEEHNNLLTQATSNFKGAIDNYNSQKYDEAISSSNLAKEEFLNAKNLSLEGKNLVQNIKNKEWLAEFKEIFVQMEEIRIKQCNYLIESAEVAKNKDTAHAQEAINKMSELNKDHDQMQKTLEDIKNQHPEDFK